jgi:hypothetical protein
MRYECINGTYSQFYDIDLSSQSLNYVTLNFYLQCGGNLLENARHKSNGPSMTKYQS